MLLPFRSVWAVDFEFTARPGHKPVPICLVARELRSGRLERHWLADGAPPRPPYETGPDSLFIAFYASAELGCHLALNWPMPVRILDLFVEFRNETNGRLVPCGNGLLGALAYYGLPSLDAAEKSTMRELAIRGEPFTDAEQRGLLDYCQSDVDALARLLPVILPKIDLPRALLRGRYMAAAARMEWNGVPIDADALARLRMHWQRIKGRLVEAIDADYGVFVPADRPTLDPTTRLGAAILETAKEWSIDPYALVEAVEQIWNEDRKGRAEFREATQRAREATGLNAKRIEQMEEAGKDFVSWPGLDVSARELAGMYPILGIGRGYDLDAPEEDDNAARLWELLREPVKQSRPRHHPDILRQAAELVGPGSGARAYRGLTRFCSNRWADYLARKGTPWPRLPSGALALDDDTFKEMARAYPAEIGPIRELRYTLGQLRLNDLAVGPDANNRCLLSVFQSKTGRNQPSNAKFIFGPSTWLRGLIRPEPGRAVAYCDWSGQEYGIAAALSGDRTMKDDYASGDPYLAFGKRIGAVPPNATKRTHSREREQLKTCCGLGAMYGAGSETVARTLGIAMVQAREWLRAHRELYSTYWRWSDAAVDAAMLSNRTRSVFGWVLHIGADVNPRSVRNFPMQANGAEMMRLACCLATERGIRVCCPVHDALLVEGPADEFDAIVEATKAAMREASELVLPGFPLRTDAKIVRYPDRYMDGRGERMWATVSRLLDEIEAEAVLSIDDTPGIRATPCMDATPSTDEGGPLASVPTLSNSYFSLRDMYPLEAP